MSLTRTNVSLFPGAVDTDTQLEHIVDNVTEIGAIHFNNLKDSTIAIETTIGVNSSFLSTSFADQLASLEAGGFFLKSGDVMHGDLTFHYQDLNRSTFPARLFLGNCNCAIGFDGREFFPGNIQIDSDEKVIVTYDPDIGSKFLPMSFEKEEGVVADGVVPFSMVGIRHNDSASSVDWGDMQVSKFMSDQETSLRAGYVNDVGDPFPHRVRILDDLEITGSLRVKKTLFTRGTRVVTTTNEWGITEGNTTDLFGNALFGRHANYSNKLTIVGDDSIADAIPVNILDNTKPSLLVTKGAMAEKLFGGEYGIQFLGAKFWKSWYDMDLAPNVMPYGLDESNYSDLYGSGLRTDAIKAQFHSPGGMSTDFISILKDPLSIEIPYDTCFPRDGTIDSLDGNILSAHPTNRHKATGLERTGIAATAAGETENLMVTSKYKMFWITITCETEDPASIVLLAGKKTFPLYSTLSTWQSEMGTRYYEVQQAYSERRFHGKENICTFSFLINPAALENMTVRNSQLSNTAARAQVRSSYHPLSCGAQNETDLVSVEYVSGSGSAQIPKASVHLPFIFPDYGYLEPSFGDHLISVHLRSGLTPICSTMKNTYASQRNLDTGISGTASTFTVNDSDITGSSPDDDKIVEMNHLVPLPAPRSRIGYFGYDPDDIFISQGASALHGPIDNNAWLFTLRRHRVNKPYPKEEFISLAGNPYQDVDRYPATSGAHLPIAKHIAAFTVRDLVFGSPTAGAPISGTSYPFIGDDNVNGYDPASGHTFDATRRDIIEGLFRDKMPDIKNILITIYAVDNLPNGYSSIDFDPGTILTGERDPVRSWSGLKRSDRWALGDGFGLTDSLHDMSKAKLNPRQFIGYSYYADDIVDDYVVQVTSDVDARGARNLQNDYRRIWRY